MKPFSWNPCCLAFSSGNVSFSSILGCLTILEKKNILEGIEMYSSSGNGCFASILLCCGYTVKEIAKIMENQKDFLFYDFCSYQNMDKQDPKVVRQYLEINSFFTMIFEEKYSNVPTFEEFFFLTGKTIYLTTYNLDKNKCVYLSKNTFPCMDLLTAIHLSTGIRDASCKLIFEGDTYIDCGCFNPMPVSCFSRARKVLALKSYWEESRLVISERNPSGYSSMLLNIAVDKLSENSFKIHCSHSLFLTTTVTFRTRDQSDEYVTVDFNKGEKQMKKALLKMNSKNRNLRIFGTILMEKAKK